jgi:integrase
VTRNKLTPALVSKYIRTPGPEPRKFSDGGSLYLYVKRPGVAYWVHQWEKGGKTVSNGLGSATNVSLAAARKARDANNVARSIETVPDACQICGASGRVNLDRKHAAGQLRGWICSRCDHALSHAQDNPTTLMRMAEYLQGNIVATPAAAGSAGKLFGAEAASYLERHASEWDARQRDRYATLLRLYAQPLDRRPVMAISVEEVKAILAPIWDGSGSSKGRRLRAIVEKVLNAAGVPQPGPAALSRLDLSRARDKSKPLPSLPWQQVPAAMQRLDDSAAARAVRFIVLTATRLQESLRADWSEIDLIAKTWTIPAERMKMDEAHRVPLSDAAIACLGKPGRGRVFSLSHNPVYRLVKEIDPTITTHGFRATMATWAQHKRYDRDVIEKALAHSERNKTLAAYQRDDLLEARRPMMEAWAAYVTAR